MAGRRSSSRHGGQSSATTAGDPDIESFSAAFGDFTRVGRSIFFQGTLDADAHRAFVERLVAEGIPRLEAHQQRLRDRLDEILQQVDPVDLLSRAAFIYLPIDPDTFKEWETDRNPAHIEYLGLQVVPLTATAHPDPPDPMAVASLTSEAIVVARDLFEVTGQLMAYRQADPTQQRPDQERDYRLRAQLDALSVRGSAYAEHARAILFGTVGAYDAECEAALGFTAPQAVNLIDAIVDVVADRLEPLYEMAESSRQEMLKALPRQRRKRQPGPVPDWIVAMKPTDAKRFVGIVTQIWMFHRARALQTVTVEQVSEQSGIAQQNVRAFLDAFSCTPDIYDAAKHRLPVGAHPLTARPILKIDEGYILLVPSSLLEAIRPRMEDLLSATRHWEGYLRRRARFVEEEAVRRLAAALPGSTGKPGLHWASPSDESDLDGLVTVDDFAFRMQCKAGRLHAATRRGAPERMRRNLKDLVREAARQHAALAGALDTQGADSIGLGKYRKPLEDAPFQVEMIVVLDDLTVWSTHAHELRRVGVLPLNRTIPWIISLADLMAVTDLLGGAQLLHFVTRRLRLEALGRIATHDELDWVGHYLLEGLYFDDIFSGDHAPDQYRLLSYTEKIDSWYFTREGLRTEPAPKPEQPVPLNLARLIARLEEERPKHWTVAAMALLIGDMESRDLWEKILSNARSRRLTFGWSNGSQIYVPQVGVTYFMDYRPPRKQFSERLAHYVSEKVSTMPTRSWVAIGDDGERLYVDARSDAGDGLPDIFRSAAINRPDRSTQNDLTVRE